MMRIAYLVNQYPAVSHTFIRREIRELERLGHVVERYSLRDTRNLLVDLLDVQEANQTTVLLSTLPCIVAVAKIAITRPIHFVRALMVDLLLWRNGGGIVRHLSYLAEACHLIVHASSRIQHLHAHFGTNSASIALISRILGGPSYSFTVHGPEEFDRPVSLSLAAKVISAEFAVAVSSFGKSQLCRWCRYADWHKLHIVHCGLDDEFLASDPTLPTQSATLVCVGRLSEQKGQMLLLEAAKRLMTEGIAFRLILVGDGELRGALESMIESSGLTNHVTITGWQTGAQVRKHISDARALVLPSFAEGLPVVIMESLALARPVISTYVAGIPELVLPGENGWLVPAGSVDELAAAMQQALNASTDELFQMGLKGRERVREHHSASTEAARLAKLFAATA